MNKDPIIPHKHLYTIKWTQPYPTDRMRPYMRDMMEAVERAIESQLERNYFPEAKEQLERIKNASKS